jgi:hypothetical protein
MTVFKILSFLSEIMTFGTLTIIKFPRLESGSYFKGFFILRSRSAGS